MNQNEQNTKSFSLFTEFQEVETGGTEKLECQNKKSAKPTISSEVKLSFIL